VTTLQPDRPEPERTPSLRVLVGGPESGKTTVVRRAISTHDGVCWVAANPLIGGPSEDGWVLDHGRHVYTTNTHRVIEQAVTAITTRQLQAAVLHRPAEVELLVCLDDPPPGLFEDPVLADRFLHVLRDGPANGVVVLLATRDLEAWPAELAAALRAGQVRELTEQDATQLAHQRLRLLQATARWFDQHYDEGDLVAIADDPDRRVLTARLVPEADLAADPN
jgi:hypothetical protein